MAKLVKKIDVGTHEPEYSAVLISEVENLETQLIEINEAISSISTGGNVKIITAISDYPVITGPMAVDVRDTTFDVELIGGKNYFIEYNLWLNSTLPAPTGHNFSLGSSESANDAKLSLRRFGTVENAQTSSPFSVIMLYGFDNAKYLYNVGFSSFTKYLRIRGTLRPSGDMTLSLWWNSNVANDTWTVKQNSFMKIEESI